MKRPTVPEVRQFAKALKQRGGCCLHIVLEDGNTKDGDVRFCLEQATNKGHADCKQLAEMLLLMTQTQRRKLACE